MRKKLFLGLTVGLLACTVVACGKEKDEKGKGTGGDPNTPITLPEPNMSDFYEKELSQEFSELEYYEPSLKPRQYRPITVQYKSHANSSSWKTEKTRVLPYLAGFTANHSETVYVQSVNKYGSSTKNPRQAVTGRFYTKYINGRWWIVDPEGYLHYERSLNSVRQGTSTRNKSAFASKYGSNANWMSMLHDEMAAIGFHGVGAFGSSYFADVLAHNAAHPDRPLIIAPSCNFLSFYRSSHKPTPAYPGGTSDNAVGFVFRDDWESTCLAFAQGTEVAPYLNNPHVLGIFSENEINFSSMNSKILDRFLAISDKTDPAYLRAKEFMTAKGTSTVTDALNDEFAGIVAEKYYSGVKSALRVADPQLLYLGTRLHGTPKYLKGVIKAAGRHCDIVSINYYSRWSPELTTWVKDWAELAGKPFMVTEFYTKNINDSDLENTTGAGLAVPTEKEKAWAYQHFTLGLLEAKNCVGWHWFKYQDDDHPEYAEASSKGMFRNDYTLYPYLSEGAKRLNYNVYRLIEFFDGK